jgi:hypothetical protein
MDFPKIASIVLSLLGLMSGLIAAYYWFAASRVVITPTGRMESGDAQLNTMGWVVANMDAFSRSGALNQRAAEWTAATVLVSTFASVCSTLPGP